MTKRPIRASGVAIAVLASGAAIAAPPANDDCSTPTLISGNGVFNFDLTEATTGVEGQDGMCSPDGTTAIENDVWFLWTASCDGLVDINTCGQTNVDTKIAYWRRTTCPLPGEQPFCCDDDGCGQQSQINCEAFCGEQFLIQIGKRPDGLPGGPGTVTITCQGDPCPGSMCEVVPGECCAGRPQYEAPDFAAFTGRVAVGTASPAVIGGAVLTIYDFSDFSSAIPNTNFPIARYSDPSWTATTLGSIFGVTFDAAGNIYVTTSTCYNTDVVAAGGAGGVYKVDAITGAVTVFATLPNTGPALGNIAYDCENDQFFVTNHEDGKIYRLDNAGAIASTYDHGAPDDGSAGFAPLGQRLWGVMVHAGRVFYGVWNEDIGAPDATVNNEVWSIALSGGDFSGSGQLEVSIAPAAGVDYTHPVADIRFSPTGSMLVAERGISGDTFPVPHDSRLREYECVNGQWGASANAFDVGTINLGSNCAGGVDIDTGTGRVWSSGDALQFNPDTIYGYQGLPAAGGDVTTSILVDYNGNLTNQDKTDIGDIDISCEAPCLTYTAEVECEIGPTGATGKYTVTIELTNYSGVTAQYVLLPGAQTVPNVITLNPPLPGDGSAMQTIVVTLCDVTEGEFCFPLILADEEVEACCETEICLDLPACDCALFPEDAISIECDSGGFILNFNVQNLTSDVIEHLFLIPLPVGTGVQVTPDYFDVAPIAPGGTASIGPVLITGAASGEEVCIRVTLHNEGFLECCSEVLCLTMPDCNPLDPCDINRDGIVNFVDLLLVLSNWGTCCDGDVNGDGAVNVVDLILVLGSWSR